MAKMLYEGKAKKVFETENPNEVIIYYKDFVFFLFFF